MPSWVMFTKRTDVPKLGWLEEQLDELNMPHRRNGRSWHAPIMEVPEEYLEAADSFLQSRMPDGRILDEIEDDDPMFSR
jgi:hypothetical protein